MKVLYVGYYKEKSDWGRQTTNNILALKAAGVDVACRSIELGGGSETPQDLVELEDKEVKDCDYCIQHVFPEHMVGTSKFKKNIGFMANNFIRLDHSTWVEKLNLVDEVWINSQACWIENLTEELRSRTKVIPFALDTEDYHKRYKEISIKGTENRFKFYTFCEPSNVNGLSWLLSAFHSEFSNDEMVSLVINVKVRSDNDSKSIEELSGKIKGGLRLHSSVGDYLKDVIINIDERRGPHFEIHQACDCYISTNTSFNFPMAEIDAAGFGNFPIFLSKSSMTDYLGSKGVNSIYKISQNNSGVWSDSSNGRDYWICPCEMDLKNKMRASYNEYLKDPMKYKINNKAKAAEKLSNFSMESIGQKMKETLCSNT